MLEHLATSSVLHRASIGLLLVLKHWDVSLIFLKMFCGTICKPGSLAWSKPDNCNVFTHMCIIFAPRHFYLEKALEGFNGNCSSVMISFAKAKNATNIRNLCIRINELHDDNCFKYMYGFN